MEISTEDNVPQETENTADEKLETQLTENTRLAHGDNDTLQDIHEPPKSLKNHRRIAVIDSDSESEHPDQSHPQHEENEHKSQNKPNRMVVDSDSDSEPQTQQNEASIHSDSEENHHKSQKKHKRIAVVDSDSDSECPESSQNTENETKTTVIDSDLQENSHKSQKTALMDSDSESELASKSQNKVKKIAVVDSDSELEPVNSDSDSEHKRISDGEVVQKSRLNGLCDSDSDEEPSEELISKISAKAQKKPLIKEIDPIKPTTVKEAAEQRKEIQSESQRMQREKDVALPYHKPKSHSLKDFMARRPKLSKAVLGGGRAPPSVAIKMSVEQLEEISKRLEQREKELKEFYKSESEPEDEDDGDKEYKPPDEPAPVPEEPQSEPQEEPTAPQQDPPKSPEPQPSEPQEPQPQPPEEPQNSSYDFHLEDETEQSLAELDKEIENFELPSAPVKTQLELLKQQLANTQPRLSGNPDDVIDLEEATKPREVEELMERFAKHATSSKKHKHKVKLSIMTVESGGVHEEEVAMNVDSEEEVIEEKPGAKLVKLKEELQKQMELKKSKMWREKAKKQEEVEEEKDILDCDEEEEISDEEEEEEDELDDKPLDNEFDDGEADVDDDVKEDYEEDVPLDDDNDDEQSIESSDSEPEETEPKVLKRIIKPVDDDSDEELFNDSVIKPPNQLDSTVTADEDDIPPGQPRQLQTPIREAQSQGKSISDFLTPISFLTSIQNLSEKRGQSAASFRVPSPMKDLQKKLFSDSQCESFASTQSTIQNVTISDSCSDLAPTAPDTQDLLGICSGEFTGVTQPQPQQSEITDFKSLEQEDMIISQLLDEEELENFKKKFESPQISMSERAQEVVGGGRIDSDSEDEDHQKKRMRRIQFSDESSSEDERIDLAVDVDVEYDSEENEIPQQKIKLADFVENEAELSESEWGSEDEDEKDLDQLEFELGDTDKFDEDKVKNDLEKIHMRRMLDDDNREVKLLQEMLLEDGEMHGTGRQRQFKWKNIDQVEEGEDKKEDDDVYFDEEESEEQWRKKRHEREMFFKKSQREDVLATSQLLQIGKKFLEKSFSQNSSLSDKTIQEESDSPFNLQNKRGSFLNRSDQVLQRVAEFAKAPVVEGGGKKTTKHFLFQPASVVKAHSEAIESKKRKGAECTPNAFKKLRLTTNLSPAVKKKSDNSKKLF